ncbi:LysR family transcriptional regulator [Pseudomonas gingeri]
MIAFDRLDLNLLRVFDAVMEERSVLRASQRLHLSQSAVSHALSRLRDSVGKEIFVRTGKGMTPTHYAFEISGAVREALQNISAVLTRATTAFDPASARRSFVIAASDYSSTVLLPPFNRLLAAEAPGINLVITPSTRLDLAEQLDLGRIDIALGMFQDRPERLRSHTLWQQEEVLVTGRHHPTAQRAITLQDMATYALVVMSLGTAADGAPPSYILERGLSRQTDGYDRAALESALETLGQQPRRQVLIPHFMAIPMLLEESDLMAIVPRPLAAVFSRTLGLVTQELPYHCVSRSLELIWHSHNDADPAQRWLRSQLSEVASRVQEAASAA